MEYVYDAAGRLKDVIEPPLPGGNDYIAQFQYDKNGNRKKIKYSLDGTTSNTVYIDYTYNPDNMLTKFVTTGGPAFTFGGVSGPADWANVDGLGRLKYATEAISYSGQSNKTYDLDYVYDMRSQLTDANISNINGGNWVANYSYYKNGDMISRTVQANQTGFTYSGNQMKTAGASNLSYDENGQLTSGLGASLVWNWDNKLRHGQGSSSIDFKYDPTGNRIWKKSGSATIRKYIVDVVGDLPVILLELDPNNNINIEKTYIYANSQIIAQHDGNYNANRYFYLHDRLGSVRLAINSAGDVNNTYTYNSFGELFPTETAENVSNPFKFSGQYYDTETGQYHLRARQYDPYLSRFTSRDPIFGKFEDPLSLHKYLYCQNDPINRFDPAGLFYYDLNFTGSSGAGLCAILAAYFGGGPWGTLGAAITGGFGGTTGFMTDFDTEKVHFYGGFAWTASMMPGVSGSLSFGRGGVSTGWNWSYSWNVGPIYRQKGSTLFREKNIPFSEWGGTVGQMISAGVSLFYVFPGLTVPTGGGMGSNLADPHDVPHDAYLTIQNTWQSLDLLDQAVMIGEMFNDTAEAIREGNAGIGLWFMSVGIARQYDM